MIVKYLKYSSLINCVYTIYQTYNIKIQGYSHNKGHYIDRYLLPSEKIQLYSFSFIFGSMILPVKFMDFIDTKYINLIKENSDDYNLNKSPKVIYDFLFKH